MRYCPRHWYVARTNKMHYTRGNHITLLRNGSEYFPSLLLAIKNAKHEIFLQFYIYAIDNVGLQIGNALKQAVQRNVSVNLLIDGFGSKHLSKAYVNELEQSGIRVMFYRPKISPWSLQKNRLRRMHRKVAVIDGHIGFIGGINIIDDQNTPHQTPPRIDYAVQIKGPLMHSMENNVRNLWRRVALTHLWHVVKQTHYHYNIRTEGDMDAAFVIRDNVLHRRDIENAYLSAITNAVSEIIIANAYFVPGWRFRRALIDAAKRGVTVKLLLFNVRHPCVLQRILTPTH